MTEDPWVVLERRLIEAERKLRVANDEYEKLNLMRPRLPGAVIDMAELRHLQANRAVSAIWVEMGETEIVGLPGVAVAVRMLQESLDSGATDYEGPFANRILDWLSAQTGQDETVTLEQRIVAGEPA